MAEGLSNYENAMQTAQSPIPRFLREDFKAIRLMVYDILESLPPNDFDRADRVRMASFKYGFAVTRKSLRLTCKQIKAEWTGQFLRSTTICVGGTSTPSQFRDVFLPYLSDAEINKIGRVSYNGSRDGMFGPGGRKCPNLSAHDAKLLKDFTTILQRDPRLQLETLGVKLCHNDPGFGSRTGNEIVMLNKIFINLDGDSDRFNVRKFEEQMLDTALKGASVLRLFERGTNSVLHPTQEATSTRRGLLSGLRPRPQQ